MVKVKLRIGRVIAVQVRRGLVIGERRRRGPATEAGMMSPLSESKTALTDYVRQSSACTTHMQCTVNR